MNLRPSVLAGLTLLATLNQWPSARAANQAAPLSPLRLETSPKLTTEQKIPPGGRQAAGTTTNVAHWVQLGDAAMELGDYEEATAHFQQALDLRADPSTYSRSARVVWTLGNGRKARWFMQKAIDASSGHPADEAGYRAELALMHWHNGALLPAALEIDKALQLAPDDGRVLHAAGCIKAAQENLPGAIAALERAAARAPVPASVALLGDLYLLTKRPEDAEKTFARVVELCRAPVPADASQPTQPAAPEDRRAVLARFYADHDRQLDEAVALAEAAHRTLKSVPVTDTLAWCYFMAGRLPEARKAIRQALRHNTPDASLLYHAGMIHAKLGETTAARQFLNRALSLNPRFHPRDAATAFETLKRLTQNTPTVTEAKPPAPVQ